MINKQVTKPLGIITVLTAGTNADDYVEEGIFFFSYTNRPSGLPAGVNGNGWLIVLNNDNRDYTKQIWISMGSSKTHDNRLPICIRGLFGENGYSDWSMLYSKSIEDILGGGNKCLSLSSEGGGLNGTDLSFNDTSVDKLNRRDDTGIYGLFSRRDTLYTGGAGCLGRDRNASQECVRDYTFQKQRYILSSACNSLRWNDGTHLQVLMYGRYMETVDGNIGAWKGVAA